MKWHTHYNAVLLILTIVITTALIIDNVFIHILVVAICVFVIPHTCMQTHLEHANYTRIHSNSKTERILATIAMVILA